jgi:hypothetical protein
MKCSVSSSPVATCSSTLSPCGVGLSLIRRATNWLDPAVEVPLLEGRRTAELGEAVTV